TSPFPAMFSCLLSISKGMFFNSSIPVAPDSFNHAQFFVLAGLKNQNIEKLKDIFHLLDRNQTGFIEKNELSFMMRIFSPEGRLLTDAETNRMMAAGDKDQDGKLGVDGGVPFASLHELLLWECIFPTRGAVRILMRAETQLSLFIL
uniref:Parvalbumin n=1 Tax=Varanus komodoensis TaxID=61221 RepID=A0A8D2J271_VARKO